VIDGAHAVSYYWVGKDKTGTLFASTPAGPFGMDQMDFLGWMYEGGGLEMYWDWYQNTIKMNVVAFPIMPRARRPSAGSSGRSRTSPTSRG